MKPLLTVLALTLPAFAATSHVLPGNAEYGSWDLNFTNYNSTTTPAYPSSGAGNTTLPWGAAINASATSATFNRLTGGGYFISSGSGVYGSFNPGSYVVADSAPTLDLSNLLFQSRLNLDPTSVLLNFNGLNQGITPTFSAVTANGTANPDYAWQWDLRAYSGTIDSYEIVISLPGHGTIYGNESGLTTISASNSFVQAIPEPSSAMLGAAAVGLVLLRRRRA